MHWHRSNTLPMVDGSTPTERHLVRLARRSFLSLWSYPGPYRDQGVGKRGEGAEVCDLLVTFENHILVFSDKDCAFQPIPDVELAWRRWYKAAILKSAHQVWGAERWIRKHPDRLFLDRACTRQFPIDLPDPKIAHFHRIVVAHDTTGRRRKLIGGTGSLLVDPERVGDMHLARREDGGQPFAIGQIDPARGYVHVFDDASLGRALRTLDTVTDFVHYLERKEAFVDSGMLVGAFGEEDLLAYYLKNTDENGDHVFRVPANRQKVLIEEGQWANFIRRPELTRKVEADQVSYAWDMIIEEVSSHAVAGTLLFTSHSTLSAHERMLRILARESRLRRRMLASALGEKVMTPVPPGRYAFRVVRPTFGNDPYYAFVVAPPPEGASPEAVATAEYRELRKNILAAYCKVVMHTFSDADQVIGIATENGTGEGRSHDVVMIERENWDDELEKEAMEIQLGTGWLTNVSETRETVDEYPQVSRASPPAGPDRPHRALGRNSVCPCGSGKKYKICHGR